MGLLDHQVHQEIEDLPDSQDLLGQQDLWDQVALLVLPVQVVHRGRLVVLETQEISDHQDPWVLQDLRVIEELQALQAPLASLGIKDHKGRRVHLAPLVYQDNRDRLVIEVQRARRDPLALQVQLVLRVPLVPLDSLGHQVH